MRPDSAVCEEILRMGERLSAKDLVNTLEGNLSVKHDGFLYITPTGMAKDRLTPEDIAVLDEQGHQTAGLRRPSSEWRLHAAAYALRPDAAAAIHCHAPYLTAHAICGLPVASDAYPELMVFFKTIEVAPYGTPGTDAVGAALGPLLQRGNIVLLANHGVLSIGPSLEAACALLEAAEATAKVLHLARQLGTPQALPPEECERLRRL